MKRTLAMLAAILLPFVAMGASYTNSFVRNGVTYVQRGGLTIKDYVVTNVTSSGSGGLTTNDVCNIVTNEVSEGWGEWNYEWYNVETEVHFPTNFAQITWNGSAWEEPSDFPQGMWPPIGGDITDVNVSFFEFEDGSDNGINATRQPITRNALGLARLTDLPPLTNGLATSVSLASLSSQLSQASQAATNYTDVATSNVVPSKSIGGYAIATNVAVEVGYGIRFLSLNDWGIDYMSILKPATDLPYNYTWNLPTYDDIDKHEMTLVDNYALSDATNDLHKSLAPTISAAAQSATNYTDSAIAATDTSYPRVIGITNINQTVQYVSIDSDVPTTLSIMLPTSGDTKDWIVYVTAQTNVTINLPAATWWLADTSATNDIAPQTPTALYFSQAADGIYTLGRQEFTEVVLP